MDRSHELTNQDPKLREEVEALSVEQRRWLAADLERRTLARKLARTLGLDESETYHQLKQFQRSPEERLRTGLAHGHRRRLAAQRR